MTKILKGIIFITLISCQNRESFNENTLEAILIPMDSFPLYNDTSAFQYFDIQHIDQGIVQGFNYPLLDLSIIEAGKNIIEISQAGESPSEFKGFIESVILDDGTILVLQQDNDSKIVIFDDKNQFLGSINLTNEISGYFPAPFESHFQAKPLSKDRYKIYFSLNSSDFTRYDAEYYKGYSIVELEIDLMSMKITDKKFLLPFNRFKEVKTAIEKNQKTWKTPTPYFKVLNDAIAVYYDFSQKVLLFDNNWNLLKSLPVNFKHKDYPQSTSFNFDYNTKNRLKKEEKLKYTNYNLCSLGFDSNRIYLTYYKPEESKNIPESFDEITKYYLPDKILHIVDIETMNEYSVTLPKHLFPYKIKVTSNDSIYYVGDSKIREDLKAYRFKLKLKENA